MNKMLDMNKILDDMLNDCLDNYILLYATEERICPIGQLCCVCPDVKREKQFSSFCLKRNFICPRLRP